jgi:hypothetical protein
MRKTSDLSLHNNKSHQRDKSTDGLKKTTTNMRNKTLPCEARMAILLYIKYLDS